VLAIEANPQTAVKLGFNVRANELDNVRVINSAVGPREDTLPLWQEPSNCGFATFVKDLTTGEWAGDWSPTFVKVRPLTAIADDQNLTGIDVLKVDVEGFEDRVVLPFLRHAEKSLWPRVILLETNCRPYWTEDCLPELANRGYRMTGRTNDNMIFELAS
jgi:FkbM family methyltransferase